MNLSEYPRLGEKVFRRRLSNGLEVVVVNKPFHARRYGQERRPRQRLYQQRHHRLLRGVHGEVL